MIFTRTQTGFSVTGAIKDAKKARNKKTCGKAWVFFNQAISSNAGANSCIENKDYGGALDKLNQALEIANKGKEFSEKNKCKEVLVYCTFTMKNITQKLDDVSTLMKNRKELCSN
ncbi:MAG: hypothetical protein ABIH83_05955 [Candidatus Micrarchaeota archaeon]